MRCKNEEIYINRFIIEYENNLEDDEFKKVIEHIALKLAALYHIKSILY